MNAMSSALLRSAIAASLLLVLAPATAAPAPVVPYQGRVFSKNEPFSGSGRFKFAFVNAAGTTTYWSHDGTSSGGAAPSGFLTVPVNLGAYAVALGDPDLPGMSVIDPEIFDHDAVLLRVWFDDGDNGFQQLSPDQPVQATGYAMMALSVPDGSIGSAQLGTGAVTSTKLAADAVTSAKIANGAVGTAHLASSAVTQEKIAAGAVDATRLAAGAATANLLASSASPVGSGGIIFSEQFSSPALLAAGYQRTGTFSLSEEAWTVSSASPEHVVPSETHTAIWTGTRMIVWNGEVAASFDPVTGTWTPVSKENQPTPRRNHRAVWTGSKMIVFGGVTSELVTGFGANSSVRVSLAEDFGIYDPATDSWETHPAPVVPAVGFFGQPTTVPFTVRDPVVVWTGSRMLVWGGETTAGADILGATSFKTSQIGRAYDPATHSWSALPEPPFYTQGSAGAYFPAQDYLFIFGGSSQQGLRYHVGSQSWATTATPPDAEDLTSLARIVPFPGLNLAVVYSADGLTEAALYFPATNSWVDAADCPTPLYGAEAVAITQGSTQGIYFFGESFQGEPIAYLFNPLLNTWTAQPAPPSGNPAPRFSHTMVSTGASAVVWGGGGYSEDFTERLTFSDGGIFTPATGTWADATSSLPRSSATAVWTGSALLVWGGNDLTGPLASGARYDPVSDTWTTLSTAGAPSARNSHSMTWAPELGKMLVWGGFDGSNALGDGAYYDPATNTWSPAGNFNPPTARHSHSCVWDGSSFIIWGGVSGSTVRNDGRRLFPATNLWSADLPATGAPSIRHSHTALWDGTQMIVWGGISGGSRRSTGGRYDPATGTWSAITTTQAPQARYFHSAVWSGTEMIIFGGNVSSGATATGHAYHPGTNTWRALPAVGAPEARYAHSAVWAGDQMIVFGGTTALFTGRPLSTGARYRPDTDTWTALVADSAPAGRSFHNAVWTGEEMLIFGGVGLQLHGDLIRYNPGRVLHLYQRP
jgi:N-acetylneuraminic acid mutarotase